MNALKMKIRSWEIRNLVQLGPADRLADGCCPRYACNLAYSMVMSSRLRKLVVAIKFNIQSYVVHLLVSYDVSLKHLVRKLQKQHLINFDSYSYNLPPRLTIITQMIYTYIIDLICFVVLHSSKLITSWYTT